ncbi:peptidoglycan-binding protein [Streptomyces sp. H27-H5]|uniref:peptidoglycan-binding protein n=1 Tax=Streptomyces sp. H27-H5 TaxID=2996460 RepID=UPI00226E4713|nr:peptidoglycan-binding protein [Streptomyces sp. H27-H5]MCY0956059.1 peptidoglycan-binding protein [Streptomyces sp. H27-H5]
MSAFLSAGARDAHRTILVVSTTLAAVPALIAVLPGAVAGTALLLVWGSAYGGVSVSLQTWMIKAAPEAAEAASSLMVATFNFAIAAGALVGGPAVDGISAPRVAPPSGLSVPVLPARSPDVGPDEDGSQPPAPVSPAVPSASASASGATGRGAGAPSIPPGRGAATTAPASPRRPPTASPGNGTSGTLKPGDRGSEVRALQERLHGQGFTYVSTTGVYDEQTRRGVAQLQSDRSITGDPRGIYGPATRAAFD